MKNWIVVILLILNLLSCEKLRDEGSGNKENQGIPLISEEDYGTAGSWKYSYNQNNLPEVIRRKWSYQVFFYEKDNRLTGYDIYEDPGIYSSDWSKAQAAMNRKEWVSPLNTKKSLQTTFAYEEGKILIAKTTPYQINASHEIYTYIDYDLNDRIIKQTYESGFTTFSYDNAGNLIKREQYYLVNGQYVLIVKHDYEFDDNPNPFIVFNKIPQPGKYSNKNNIIRETVTFYENGIAGDIQVNETSYEYNEKGYPISRDGLVTYRYYPE